MSRQAEIHQLHMRMTLNSIILHLQHPQVLMIRRRVIFLILFHVFSLSPFSVAILILLASLYSWFPKSTIVHQIQALEMALFVIDF